MSKLKKDNKKESSFGTVVKVQEYIEGAAGFSLYIGILFPLGILGYQCYFWLKAGYWKSIPATVLLYRILPDGFFSWLADESSWVGFKKIILEILEFPLSLFLFLFFMILMGVFFSLAEMDWSTAKDEQKQ